MPLLSSKSFDFRYRHPLDADFAQSIPDLIKLEWLNDGFDLFHPFSSQRCPLTTRRRPAPAPIVLESLACQSGSFQVLTCGPIVANLRNTVKGRQEGGTGPAMITRGLWLKESGMFRATVPS